MQLQGYLSEMSKGLYLDLNYYFQVEILLPTPQLKNAHVGIGTKMLNQDTRVQSKAQEIFISTWTWLCLLRAKPEIGSSLPPDHAPQSYLRSTGFVNTAQGGPHLHGWATSSTQPGLQGWQVWTYQLLQVCIIGADAIKASIPYSVPLEPPALSANFLRFKKVYDAIPQAGPVAIPHN